MDTNDIITTFAGNGTSSFPGSGGAATNAKLNNPFGLALDVTGNLYFADESNQRIRKVDLNGIITTVAGNGSIGSSGDGGAATNASFWNPMDVTVDNNGNLLVSDNINEYARKITAGGIISALREDMVMEVILATAGRRPMRP